jgi:hypothetical protein
VRLSQRLSILLCGFVAAFLVLAVGAAGQSNVRPTHAGRCTHGVSSVGPAVFANGRLVGGSLTPHTEACLP